MNNPRELDPRKVLRHLGDALDEPPTDEEARREVAALGVDLPALAARLRARATVAEVEAARTSGVRFRGAGAPEEVTSARVAAPPEEAISFHGAAAPEEVTSARVAAPRRGRRMMWALAAGVVVVTAAAAAAAVLALRSWRVEGPPLAKEMPSAAAAPGGAAPAMLKPALPLELPEDGRAPAIAPRPPAPVTPLPDTLSARPVKKRVGPLPRTTP